MDKHQGFMKALKCRECGKEYPLSATHVCEFDFGPLEVAYDYDRIKKSLTRAAIESRPHTMWRYRELLPIAGEPTVGCQVGYTPLVKADRLAKHLGIRELWIKNDAVNYPTLSFKDRVVSVALSRSKELGFKTVACASTGNLANSVAANAAAAGLKSYVFIPSGLELGKVVNSLVYGANVITIKGHYDEVNRLCAEIAGKFGWAFVNVNMRPYYAEGSKSMGYEICEQLGWRTPQRVVAPMASGSLFTKIWKGFQELHNVGLIDEPHVRMSGAQAEGCSPIATAYANHTLNFVPQKPNTIARSLAIGNPADGYYALKVMEETDGGAEMASGAEIVEGVKLLAETEGIFAETAGGVTIGCLKKLVASGFIRRDEETVAIISGGGLKTIEAVADKVTEPLRVPANASAFDKALSQRQGVLAGARA